MRNLLTLNKDGCLALRANGTETAIEPRRVRNVLLLIDTSMSMAGDKIEQAKAGARDFARSAIGNGYAIALAVFAGRAAMICDPTIDDGAFSGKIARVDVGLLGIFSSYFTDLASGLILAGKFQELSAVVIVTDGKTEQQSAFNAASPLKARGIAIICIGTDDADKNFLTRLATRSELALHVAAQDMRLAISDASRLLGIS